MHVCIESLNPLSMNDKHMPLLNSQVQNNEQNANKNRPQNNWKAKKELTTENPSFILIGSFEPPECKSYEREIN